MRTYSVVIGDYPHTTGLKDGTYRVQECNLAFIEVNPVWNAYAPMVRELKFDVSELAIATYLQAREAGKAISLLPVMTNGHFHHHSITQWPGREPVAPRELAGRRVGVRAYSQTTGLWVRGILKDEYGVEADQITWVTTEGPHVTEYVEPPNVERTESTLLNLLRDGYIAAAILGPVKVGDEGASLVPVIPDWEKAEHAWFERHGAVPINHMLTVRTDVLKSDPGAVRAIYRAFTTAIDDARSTGRETPRHRAAHGFTDDLMTSLKVAIRYALEQDVIRTETTVDELFGDFQRYVGA